MTSHSMLDNELMYFTSTSRGNTFGSKSRQTPPPFWLKMALFVRRLQFCTCYSCSQDSRQVPESRPLGNCWKRIQVWEFSSSGSILFFHGDVIRTCMMMAPNKHAFQSCQFNLNGFTNDSARPRVYGAPRALLSADGDDEQLMKMHLD